VTKHADGDSGCGPESDQHLVHVRRWLHVLPLAVAADRRNAAGDADWTPTRSDQSKLATHSPAYNPGSTKDPAEADYFNYMVHSVKATMHKSSWGIKTAGGTQLAEVVAYDWNNGADGFVDHVGIITGFADDGSPLVSQHSPARLNRGWAWDPDANAPLR
jgi:hypothetical protein